MDKEEFASTNSSIDPSLELTRFDLVKHLSNFVKEFGLISHNIDSFNQLVSPNGISTSLKNDFNKVYYVEIPNS